ncbi:MAG: penicillin-binding protein 2 [Maribacter sp.]|jgi:penicillin-binding protein 2
MAKDNNNNNRQYIIQAFFIIASLTLIAKSCQIQILDSSYADTARAVVVSDITIYPSRGLIADRNGKLLVANKAMYDLMVIYNLVGAMDTTKFCNLLSISEEAFVKNLEKDFGDTRFDKKVPFAFIKKISAEQYARFQESMYEFPGFFIQMRNVRNYPYGIGAHVLGYVNEVTQLDIDESEEKVESGDLDTPYERGDYIGAKGLELQYEDQLKGVKGEKKVMKDNFGRIEGSWRDGSRDIQPASGLDLISSLDAELQRYAEKLMGNKRGGVVAIEPSTGEILVMVSTPTYNPNLLSINRDRGRAFSRLVQDTLRPFYDRSIMAQYPPGSIFKAITSLVGMKTGVWDVNRGVGCSGGYDYGGSRRLGCHNHVYLSNVVMGLQHSCNSYYCQLFRDVVDQYGYKNAGAGLDTLMKYVRGFGMGSKLGVDLPGEKSGLIPDSKYYDKWYPKDKGGWKSPTIISNAIGQGEIQMTTLQMANAAAAIANKGWYITPHLAKGFMKDGKPADVELSVAKHYTGIESHFFDPVHDGMEMAVKAGTARRAEVPSFILCGKTGTSENRGKDHSVFFCFAPKENPQIAIAVFVENAGFGGTYAAPIASLIAEMYLNDGVIDEKRQQTEDRILEADLLHAK